MRSTSFRTARLRVPNRIPRLVAGVVMLGLALSASAKDEFVPGSARIAGAKVGAVVVAKPGAPVAVKPVAAKRRAWLEVGVASWYGSQFQGRRTAGGERFNMNDMTCAHPTLPMGTWLRVTNLKNRRTAFVRVNDRGPVIEGRIVDLSQAAARMLGMDGIGRVKLESLRDDNREMAAALMAQMQMPELPLFPALVR